jgi:hypothetical protein
VVAPVAARTPAYDVAAGLAADRGQRRGGRAVQARGGQDLVQDRIDGTRVRAAEGVGIGAEQLPQQRPQGIEGRLRLRVR